MINGELLKSLIDTNIGIIIKKETASTNTDARELAKHEPSSPLLIVADSQTGGRGRQGKTFESPTGGLYMSLLLPTDMPITQTIGATSCAAVAVKRAILAASGAECGIKWINDLYISGGKVCGILAESVNDYSSMRSRYLVIGVGVNLSSAPVLSDSTTRAVSLSKCGFSVSREELCAAIANELIRAYRMGFDFSVYREEYCRSSILIGQEISFVRDGVTEYGTAEAITERGGLQVRCRDKTVVLDSGEVTVRVNSVNK